MKEELLNIFLLILTVVLTIFLNLFIYNSRIPNANVINQLYQENEKINLRFYNFDENIILKNISLFREGILIYSFSGYPMEIIAKEKIINTNINVITGHKYSGEYCFTFNKGIVCDEIEPIVLR